jgi:hypothetical protein
MSWSPKTKPTLANVRKRLKAAVEALDGAETLLKNHPRAGSAKLGRVVTHIRHARGWVDEAIVKAVA